MLQEIQGCERQLRGCPQVKPRGGLHRQAERLANCVMPRFADPTTFAIADGLLARPVWSEGPDPRHWEALRRLINHT